MTAEDHLNELLSRRRLPALDGLRAVAVFTVILYHFGFVSIPGDLGVNAFFVLSGFLITWLLLQEFNRTGHLAVGEFYARRMLRIAPAYYGFLFLIYVEEHVRGYQWDVSLTLSGLCYVVNYYNVLKGHPNTAIAHAWSLGVEQQFYVLWPLLLGLVVSKGTKAVGLVIATVIVAVAGWRSIAYLGMGASSSYVYNAFETRLDCLAIGCLTAVCCQSSRFKSVIVSLSMGAVSPIMTLILLLYSRIGGSESYHYSIGFTIDSILLAILMMQLLIKSQEVWWSWIDHPVMIYLGRISYSLYLYHLLALGIAARIVPAPVSARLAFSMVTCVMFASISYWLIEVPFLQWKKALTISRTGHRRSDWIHPVKEFAWFLGLQCFHRYPIKQRWVTGRQREKGLRLFSSHRS